MARTSWSRRADRRHRRASSSFPTTTAGTSKPIRPPPWGCPAPSTSPFPVVQQSEVKDRGALSQPRQNLGSRFLCGLERRVDHVLLEWPEVREGLVHLADGSRVAKLVLASSRDGPGHGHVRGRPENDVGDGDACPGGCHRVLQQPWPDDRLKHGQVPPRPRTRPPPRRALRSLPGSGG